jgi:hypothetical protein
MNDESARHSHALMDLTVYGRQERWEDSPAGWPQPWPVDGRTTLIDGRPIAQWPRLAEEMSCLTWSVELRSAGRRAAQLPERRRNARSPSGASGD